MDNLDLNSKKIGVLIGAAISGLAACVNTYDVISGVNTLQEKCDESDALKKSMTVRFGIILALSSLAIIAGIVVGVITRKDIKLMPVIILILAGILGIIYIVVDRYIRSSSNFVKLGLSWASLIGFVVIGYMMSKSSESTED